MREIIQVLQIILFVVAVVSLWTMGALLLMKPVFILHRRWRLLVFVPLLAANLLAIIENNLSSGVGSALGGGFWLILGVDLFLSVGLWLASGGFQVFGLNPQEVMSMLALYCHEAGMAVTSFQEETTLFLSGKESVMNFIVDGGDPRPMHIKVWERHKETMIKAGSGAGNRVLREIFPLLRRARTVPTRKTRATGILYIVVGVVFAVLGWIFFFEPRLVLLE